MFQSHYHATRPLTTAHLAQTMSLLSLTSSELMQQIEGELAANPALEMVDEIRCPTCHRLLGQRGICPVCSNPVDASAEEPIVFISTREVVGNSGEGGFERDSEEPDGSQGEDLSTYVFRQIAPEIKAEDRRIVAYMLTNLDEDGLIPIRLIEVAQYFHVPLDHILELQRVIQKADPLGVGSSSAREALLVQLEFLRESRPVPSLAECILRDGFELLSRRQFSELARQLHAPVETVRQVAVFIGENLNPFPGRTYWGDIRQPSRSTTQVYYRPDIIVNRSGPGDRSPLVVEILFPLWGTLRVNPLYRTAIQEASDEQKDLMREDMERASLFVKCLQQRNHTMQRLLQRIVSIQREFIVKGERHLKPLTRASLAKELGVHESTISRAVANKAVQLPNGKILPLSEFFDRSLSARIALKDLVASEVEPLSDSDLVHLMAERGYEVARRTVAKYRAMEGILPANLRRPCR